MRSIMLHYEPWQCLPSSAELPDSDDTPVDNELQNLVPNLLLAILALIWQDRGDWFFGVDMGIYHTLRQPALVPDGFLSLGVERFIGEEGRLSYVLWEENNIVPLLALEVISKTYNQEYEEKESKYAQLGILYYVIYASDRRKRKNREPFEVYRLVDGKYVRQDSDPVWMPEIGLGIGRSLGTYEGWSREWLYWYDQDGNKYLTPEEVARQQQEQAELQRERAEVAEQQLELLLAKLRERGIDPNDL